MSYEEKTSILIHNGLLTIEGQTWNGKKVKFQAKIVANDTDSIVVHEEVEDLILWGDNVPISILKGDRDLHLEITVSMHELDVDTLYTYEVEKKEETLLPQAAWGCPDCKHDHTGQYVPDGQPSFRFDGRCMEDAFPRPGIPGCGCPRRRPDRKK